MRRIIHHLLVVFAFTVSVGSDACEYPEKFDVPNGNQATQYDLLGAQAVLVEYVSTMSDYLQCISNEEKSEKRSIGQMSVDAEKDRKDKFDKEYDSAIKEMEKLAVDFRKEVEKYKKKNSD